MENCRLNKRDDMTWNKNNVINEPTGDWGGPWTEKKLEAFSKYVWSYLVIMKKNPFWETIYFDGFVGSGSKDRAEKSELYQQLKITVEEERTYKGAAERVLDLKDNLSFDYYYFIDKTTYCLSLEKAPKFELHKIQILQLPGPTR